MSQHAGAASRGPTRSATRMNATNNLARAGTYARRSAPSDDEKRWRTFRPAAVFTDERNRLVGTEAFQHKAFTQKKKKYLSGRFPREVS